MCMQYYPVFGVHELYTLRICKRLLNGCGLNVCLGGGLLWFVFMMKVHKVNLYIVNSSHRQGN